MVLGHSRAARRVKSVALAVAALIACGAPRTARADVALSAGALLAGDDYGYRWDQYQIQLRHEDESFGEHLTARWHMYSLDENLDGILPFEGSEPAVELGAHLTDGLWWLGASAGLQGTADLEGLTGELIVARAIPLGSSKLTPRFELAREPLALTPLPLSLGLSSYRGEAQLAARFPGWMSEVAMRMEFWESDTIEGRTQNPARDRIDPNRVTTLYGYVLSEGDGWFDIGFAAKVAWSNRNTMLATQVGTQWRYNWYPAYAPPFVWETAAVLRAHGAVLTSLEMTVQLSLPLLSRETREWDGIQQSSWGTGPAEAKLMWDWYVFSSTRLRLEATIFLKPWANWDVTSDDAYRQLSGLATVEQRF